MKPLMQKIFFLMIFLQILSSESAAAKEKAKPENSLLGKSYFAVAPTMRPGRLLDAASAKGAPGYHRHLVRPGAMTTYMLRLSNPAKENVTVELSAKCDAKNWRVDLEKQKVELGAGAQQYVKLSFKPDASLPAGNEAAITVTAKSSPGQSEEIILEAETTLKHKIYFISIDSLGPEYLNLNAKGTGPGKDNDRLMPELHAFLQEGAFFPKHKSHLVAATDMNHAAYLSGAYPGRLGLYSVQVLMFGFDEKGWAVWRSTPHDLMYWGADGKPVTTIFNVVKDPAYGGNQHAFSAYVSGKDWVPEHYRNPIFGLDRIVTVTDYPDYVTPSTHVMKPPESIFNMLESRMHKLNKPDFALWEDIYTTGQAMQVIDNEDPDVCYILLGGVDEAGHFFGSAKDPSEWDDHGTPDDLSDDTSRINKSGNRLGMIKTVKNADREFGRLLSYLKERGAYENSYIIVQSDHNMETNSFVGPPLHKILPTTGYSKKKDYYAFTGSQLGMLFLRRNDPAILPKLEKTLEDYRWQSPISGEMECPVIVLDREEMKTGIDKATGQQVTPAMELYSEFYIEHPKLGKMVYPDLFIFPKGNLQFPSIGAGFGNIGLGVLPFDIPPFTVYVGGHGAPSTQPALLGIRGPKILGGVIGPTETHPADVAPTLYALEGYKIPDSVEGSQLHGLNPAWK